MVARLSVALARLSSVVVTQTRALGGPEAAPANVEPNRGEPKSNNEPGKRPTFRRDGLCDKTLSAADRAIQRAGRFATECAGGKAVESGREESS
jgi:hypothetical protein